MWYLFVFLFIVDLVVRNYILRVQTLVDSYNYFKMYLTIMEALLMRKKKIVEQSQKPIYTIYYKIRNNKIAFDSQLNVFESLVSPVGITSWYHQWASPVGITSGYHQLVSPFCCIDSCEVTRYGNNDTLEKIHPQILKLNIAGIN
jgi:hypothetical protein